MSKILIVGGSGYLGSNLKVFAQKSDEYEVYSTHSSEHGLSPQCVPLDITDEPSVDHVLGKLKPDIVIHTAALTDSNYCAAHQQEAWNVNVVGTQNIVKSVSRIDARLIYISSDQVYDGLKSFSTENDEPDPISIYGKTKLEAEKIVINGCDNYCIARTSLLYGISKTNRVAFFDNLVSNLLDNKPTQLFYDEYRTPIFLDNYCVILLELSQNMNIQGLFNVSGSESVSRYELATQIATTLSMEKSLLVPISIADFAFVDSRPHDCSMNNHAISNVLSTQIIDIRAASELIKKQVVM
jgi:dTDP-4-dehydrorhamnose reductase